MNCVMVTRATASMHLRTLGACDEPYWLHFYVYISLYVFDDSHTHPYCLKDRLIAC